MEKEEESVNKRRQDNESHEVAAAEGLPSSSAPGNSPQLAQKVEAWLAESGQRSSPELREFIYDLRSGSDELRKWAGASFERLLPLRYPRSRRLAQLSLIRNVVIFLPIMLTWYSLMVAARRFAAIRAAHPERDLNFLLVWENDLSGFHQLSTVALIDAGLIALLVILSIWVGWSEEFRDTDRVRRIEEKHAGLMVALEKDLAGYRHLSLSDLNGIVADTLKELSTVASRLNQSARRLESTTEAANESIVKTQELTNNQVAALATRLEATAASLEAAKGSHHELVDVVKYAQAQLAQASVDLSSGLNSAVVSLQQAAQQLASSLDSRIDGLTRQVTDAVSSMERGTTQMLDQVRTDFTGAANSIQTAAARTTSEMNAGIVPALQQTALDLAAASEKVAQLIRETNFGLGEAYDKISKITGQR